jgi:hypothetical protein
MIDEHQPALDVNQTEQDPQQMRRGAAKALTRKTKKKNKIRAAVGAADSKEG